MKQFLTLCMAAAMVGGAFSADAKVTLRQAMQMKEEGKAITPVIKMRNQNQSGLKAISAAPVSRFHKIQAEKNAEPMMKKAPAKILPNGDAIYGYLYYSADADAKPIGLYEFGATQSELVWADTNETGYAAGSVSYADGVVKGYILESFWGMIFGIDYVEYDFNTGDIITLVQQSGDNGDYMQTSVLNTGDGKFYGYGGYNGVLSFMWAPADDPFAYEGVPVEEMCLSLCYDSKNDILYGVSGDYQLVKINTSNGELEPVMDLNVEGGGQYLTGLAYDCKSDLFYWNINFEDDSAAMATIDLKNQKLDIYDELAYSEEYISLMTSDQFIDPNKPQRPVAGEVDFYKDSLVGFVEFTLPAFVGNDTPIEGDVEYRTYVDGNLYSTGSAAAGSVVKANFAVETGNHVFGIRAVVNGVESAMATAKAWIGNDNPLAPANVELSASELTWSAVAGGDKEGVHGGYVSGKDMTYVASVFCDGAEVAVSPVLTETSFSMAGIIDEKADLAAYSAQVVAVCNGMESDAASSNAIVAGEALVLPQYIEPTDEQFAISSVLDANEDGVCWGLAANAEGNYIYSGYSMEPSVPMDDWYFLPKMKFDDPTKFYSFSFEAAIKSLSYPEEYVEVLLCNEASPRGVVSVIIDEFTPEDVTFQTVRGYFQVRQAGDYYIAIRCTSEGDQYGINARNFKVEDNNITLESPDVVSDLAAEGAAEGVLEATVSFAMPATTMGGAALPSDAQLKAVVKSSVDEVEVEGKPGESKEVVVATVQNNNDISVSVSYGELNSPAESIIVYTGVTVPATISSLSVEDSADMLSMTLSWPAVTTPDDPEGFIDPEEVVYDIYRVEATFFGNAWALYEPGVEGTSYTYSVEAGDPQDFVQLGVVARNAAGDNGKLLSVYGIIGTPYDLPMVETFDNPEGLDLEPWVTLAGVGEPEIGLMYLKDIDADMWGDSENIVMVMQGAEGDVANLSVPRFSTKGVSAAKFSLNVSGLFYFPKVTVLGQVYGSEDYIEIGTMSIDTENYDFQKVSVELPAEFCNQDWVGLVLQVEFETGNEVLVIDDVSAEQSTGVAPVATKGGVKIAGGKNVIKVSGLNGQNVTVSTLDGRIAAKRDNVGSDATFNVEKGIYVVKAGEKNAKVIVK